MRLATTRLAPLGLALGLVALTLAAAVIPLVRMELPLLEVRQVPYSLHAGALLPGEPIGQRFLSEADGLRRIEVHFAPLGPAQQGAVELRVLDAAGAVLRRATADAAGLSPGGWLAFELEPLSGVSGSELLLELEAQGGEVRITPHLRYRGRVGSAVEGRDHSWGNRALQQARYVRQVFSLDPDLAGLAIPFDDLDAGRGAPRAVLLDESRAPLREASARAEGRTKSGHRLFSFPPWPESRFRELRLVLDDPGGSRVVGYEDGPGYVTLHRRGAGRITPLTGAVLHGEARADVDLVVRIHADAAPRALARAHAALGGRAGWALALLALGALALARAAAALAASDRSG